MKNQTPNRWGYLAVASIVINVVLFGILLTRANAKTELYVQDAQNASLQKSADGTYTLTMQNAPEALYFTDRPYRQTGRMKSGDFVNMLNSQTINPPNAILQVHVQNRLYDVPVELLKGTVSPFTLAVQYTVKPLPFQQDREYMDVNAAIKDSMDFDGAALFIDTIPIPINGQITDLTNSKQDVYPTNINDQVTDLQKP